MNAYDPEGGFCYNHDAWDDGLASLKTTCSQPGARITPTAPAPALDTTSRPASSRCTAATMYVVAARPDDLANMRAQFAPIMKEYSWKWSYSESDEEFQANWTEMVDKCKAFGYDEVTEFYLGEIANSLPRLPQANNPSPILQPV